ncbi:MAG TPA: hypothetical protein VHP33_26890 [Polyangiaceae bacterium]|nr:hypothetical protein [Polyangiaceae bacterium]
MRHRSLLAITAATLCLHCAVEPKTEGAAEESGGSLSGGSSATSGSAGAAGSRTGGGASGEFGGAGAVTAGFAGASAGAVGLAGSGSRAGAGAGGSTGDGGGATGGGAGSGSAGCDGHLLCEDFESFEVGAPPSGRWTITKNGTGTSLVVDTVNKYSGAKAAHFGGSLKSSNSVHMSTQGAPVFPVAGNTLFVRFMMYVKTYPGSQNEEMHTRLLWIGSSDMVLDTSGAGISTNDNKVYAMETYNGIGVERLSSGHYRDTSQRMSAAPNLGQWLCWEMEVDNAGGPPAGLKGAALTHLWRQGTELKLAVKGGESETWGAVPFEKLNVSFFAYQTAAESADFWIDDLVMDTKRIGCPEPR